MARLTTNPRNLLLTGATLAMAALAIILAVALTAGPTLAQDDTTTNANHYAAPVPCSEESEPDEKTARVITNGFVPVFEGFWDYEVGHLSNNFCPPKATDTGKTNRNGTKVYGRTDARIHISKTAFSIPTSYKVTVIDTRPGIVNGTSSDVTGPTIDIADYPFLARNGVVSAVDENGQFAHTPLWWVRYDGDPTGRGSQTSPLQLGLSTDLMDSKYWHNADGGDPVEFQFEAVHVLEAGAPVETHVLGANFFAFDQKPMRGSLNDPLWSDADTANFSEVGMPTGQYKPLQFAFTKPGEYLVQVNVQGHVRAIAPPGEENWDGPISNEKSITSPVQWYTFHVGPEADLGVTLTHNDETPGDDTTTVTDRGASFSVTATNNGPETAEGVVVEVSLPVDLNYSPPNPAPANIDYLCGVISWKAGSLDPGASRTLDFTAVVSTSGPKSFTVDSVVHSSTVDDNELNDTASVEVRTNSSVVTAPFFPGVTRSIVEHAVAGTHAGDPVAAINPDGRELHYALSGRCNDWFEAHSNGQIVLRDGDHTLNYDEQAEFHLTLHVSDEEITRMYGEIDLQTVDDSIPVLVQVVDVKETVHPTVTFKLTPNNSQDAVTGNPVADGRTYDLRTTLEPLPDGPLTYDWEKQGQYNPLWSNRIHTSYFPASEEQPGSQTYIVHIKWPGGGISAQHTLTFVSP